MLGYGSLEDLSTLDSAGPHATIFVATEMDSSIPQNNKKFYTINKALAYMLQTRMNSSRHMQQIETSSRAQKSHTV